ncbi:MAG: nicotinate phosphoribosyltransferase [Myxococcaceae bacterium]|nr:MAG: nicotinate phosphoribosyltransferase [Myxococcaceae bacterium]
MPLLTELYRPSLLMLTDFYQLTMAAAAWGSGAARRETVFHLLFRRAPFGSGFTVAAGLELALEVLESARLESGDLEYLAGLRGADGAPLFEDEFLAYLSRLRLEVDVDAVPEGAVVFPQEPLLRVTGPVIPCMMLESAFLNLLNFQTLIATKAARICLAAGDDPVLEFGLRRAQGPDGSVSAARAAYIGGCAATSNVLAGRLLGIPVRGTHAHSWVMLFDEEREAFEAWGRTMPETTVFLVDTYDTLEGVRRAIEIAGWLRARGKPFLGVRIDSGDLAWLSNEARRMLDDAGFTEARVYASNELDEHLIESLKQQGATIGVWGIGTRLATAHDDPALGGVYKLSMVREPGGPWQPRIKLSEQAAKISTPGRLQIRRFTDQHGAVADMIVDQEISQPTRTMVDPLDPTRRRTLPDDCTFTELLVPVARKGRRTSGPESLDAIRARVREQLGLFHSGVKRFLNPHRYPVGLEQRLYDRRTELILAARRHR